MTGTTGQGVRAEGGEGRRVLGATTQSAGAGGQHLLSAGTYHIAGVVAGEDRCVSRQVEVTVRVVLVNVRPPFAWGIVWVCMWVKWGQVAVGKVKLGRMDEKKEKKGKMLKTVAIINH